MKNTDALYELIQALTKNEKRYFKLYCSGLTSRDSSNYLLLFEAMERQKEYDADALKRSLRKPSLVKNLSSEKNYLFNLILDSLAAYHKDEPEYRIRMMLSKARLLYDKSQLKASYKLLMSAKKLAVIYDIKGLLMDISSLENNYFLHTWDVTGFKGCVEEERIMLEEIININSYKKLLVDLLELANKETYSRDPELRAKMDAIMNEELLQDENKAICFQSRLMFHHVWTHYYHRTKEHDKLVGSNKSLLHLFESNFDYTSIHLNDYLSVISNFMVDAMSFENLAGVEYGMKRMEEFPEKFKEFLSPVVQDNHRHLYLDLSIRVNTWLGNFEKTIEVLSELRPLVKDPRVLKPFRRQSFVFHGALALFAFKRYKEAFRLLQETFDINDTTTGNYVFFMQTMFLRAMMHYELDNYDVLEEHASWLRQFLTKQNKLHRTENELLKFFSDLPGCTTYKERDRLFKELYDVLSSLSKDKYEYPFLFALRFVYKWVKSKAEGRLFTDTAREPGL